MAVAICRQCLCDPFPASSPRCPAGHMLANVRPMTRDKAMAELEELRRRRAEQGAASEKTKDAEVSEGPRGGGGASRANRRRATLRMPWGLENVVSGCMLGRDPSGPYGELIEKENPDLSVGNRHARLSIRDGQVFIRDLDSRNHVFIDGKRIVSGVDVPVPWGARVSLSLLFTFEVLQP
ncbi:MAG: FHA domain-containing protein [Caulobacter sp.]